MFPYFQITLQLIILICALLFIFFGLPPLVCLCAVPVVIFFLFLAVYVNFFNKAVEVLNVITSSFGLRLLLTCVCLIIGASAEMLRG